MRNEFTAVIERDGDWHIAFCPEVPGANGQGKTKEEARKNLAEAIALILEERADSLPQDVPFSTKLLGVAVVGGVGQGSRGEADGRWAGSFRHVAWGRRRWI